jgi:hypothetical protein
MKIAFVSANRPGSWKTDLANAFSDLGHEVIPFSDLRTIHRPRADLVVWVYHHGRLPRFAPDISVTMDMWIGVGKREALIPGNHFWAAPHVFTADGGHDEIFAELGVNHHWLPPACPKRLIGFGSPSPAHRRLKIVFIGNRNHWNPVRAQMVALLSDRYGSSFAWYGPQSPLGPLRDRALNDLYASNVIVVGDFLGIPRCWSDRIPRTLGQGGFLLHTEVEGMAEQGFVNGVTLATWKAGDLESLTDQIDYYLDNQERRLEIASVGQAVVNKAHTWHHRAAQILETIER